MTKKIMTDSGVPQIDVEQYLVNPQGNPDRPLTSKFPGNAFGYTNDDNHERISVYEHDDIYLGSLSQFL